VRHITQRYASIPIQKDPSRTRNQSSRLTCDLRSRKVRRTQGLHIMSPHTGSLGHYPIPDRIKIEICS